MPPEMNEESPGSMADGPNAAPMTNPTENEGLKAQAKQGIQLAIKLLEASMMAFGGVVSPEGKKILSSINSLAKIAGQGGGPDLNQAEVKMLAAKAGPQNAGPGGAPAGASPAGGAPGAGMMMGGPAPRPM
jgi:hypothetical protein